MSMISELIEELIDNADLYTKELHDLMYRAADTIEMLSEKAREPKKGEWIKKEFMWGDYVPMKCPTCSVCGTHIVDLEMVDKDKRLLFKDGASFCPNCGADMRSCNNEEKMHDTEQTDCPWG